MYFVGVGLKKVYKALVRLASTLATSCEELTHWKRLWCWEGLGAGGEGDDRGWDGWMASRTRWTWVWVNSGSWWWTGRPGVLPFMGSQRVGHDWATELNWTEGSGALSGPLLMSMSDAFSVYFLTFIKLCYTKALEWSSLVPGPEAKSFSEITNPTSFTIR